MKKWKSRLDISRRSRWCHWVTSKNTKPKEINATMRAFHTSQHVTGPRHPTRPDGSCQDGAGRGGGETGTNQHSMLVCLPGGGFRGKRGLRFLPAAAPALPASEAPRQTPCMPASRSWGIHRARWGRGREAAGGGREGGREGRKAGATRGRVRWTEERMDRQRDGRKGGGADDEGKQKK